MIAAGLAPDRARLEVALSDPIRTVRTLVDCPPLDYTFTPWLDVAPRPEQDFVFAPTQPDIGPLAQSLAAAIAPAAE